MLLAANLNPPCPQIFRPHSQKLAFACLELALLCSFVVFRGIFLPSLKHVSAYLFSLKIVVRQAQKYSLESPGLLTPVSPLAPADSDESDESVDGH